MTIRHAATIVAALALATGVIAGSASANAATMPFQPVLPAPTGHDSIGTVELHLVDPTRTDPWVPDHPIREIMAQVWYPARDTSGFPLAPWLDPGAAPHFEQANAIPPDAVTLPVTHAHVGAPVDQRSGPRPVILYSTGSHGDRSLGTNLVEDLTSHGYIVVAIDHTHDASEVEFPGGRIEVGTLPPDTLAVNTEAVAVRDADTRFVLDELAVLNHGGNPDAEHRQLPHDIRGSMDLSRTGMFGWSIGGATAAATMLDDNRIAAGIDMDGTIYGPVRTAGLNRPFLLMSSQSHNRDTDPSWADFWSNLHGFRLDLKLAGSQHSTYSDVESLLPQVAALIGVPPDVLTQELGTIDPARAISVERTYIRAFFDTMLRHHEDRLLDGPSPRFPEMRFIP
ncbi:MAG TPA: hydrolase [Pseudonocardiaceae bacterium]|nr:hydrolase [Pseudonocardiaceae bacterium]